MPIISNGYAWTCRMIGVDANGNSGPSYSPDRSVCEWFKFQITGTGNSSGLSYSDSGWVGDPYNQNMFIQNSFSTPWSYFMPSLMVNSRGDMVMGFSGTREDQRISAFYTGRLATDFAGTTRPVKLLKAGISCFNSNRWGDYSYTTLDPTDNLTLWTIQEYAEEASTPSDTWGTWIGAITPF